MKRKLLPIVSLLALSCGVQANTLGVSQGPLTLSKDDFRPITKSYANREAVVGYVALVDVTGAQLSLLFDIAGKVSTRWFAGNFGLTTKVTCNGVPVGADVS